MYLQKPIFFLCNGCVTTQEVHSCIPCFSAHQNAFCEKVVISRASCSFNQYVWRYNVLIVQINRNHLHDSFMKIRVMYESKRNFFCYQIACVALQESFFIPNHSLFLNVNVIQFRSPWKCVLRVNVNILTCLTIKSIFDVANVVLVQINGNHLYVSLTKGLSIVFHWLRM
jgi:hypothetical protein